MTNDVVQYKFGDVVCHKTNTEDTGIVTGIVYRPNGGVQYLVTWEDKEEGTHYDIELCEPKLNLKGN